MDGRQEIRTRQDSGSILKEIVSTWSVLPIPWGGKRQQSVFFSNTGN